MYSPNPMISAVKVSIISIILLPTIAIAFGLFFPSTIHAISPETTLRVKILEGRLIDIVRFRSDGPIIISFGDDSLKCDDELSLEVPGDGNITIVFNEDRITTHEPVTLSPGQGNSPLEIALEGRWRPYRGFFSLTSKGTKIEIINTIHLEDYLLSVVPSEMEGEELMALMAQAIVSRTFAITHIREEKNYDFGDLTGDQSYRGIIVETEMATIAVTETAGMILTFEGEPATVYYHSCSGGMTSAPEYVWGGDGFPYLIPIRDEIGGEPLCRRSPHFHWEAVIERDNLHSILTDATGITVTGVSLTKLDPSGRVMSIRLSGYDIEISGEDFRIAVGRVLGWGILKSTLFEMTVLGDSYVFTGRGLGHGVGMCQWGAFEMARMGFDYGEILEFYFPGTKVYEVLP